MNDGILRAYFICSIDISCIGDKRKNTFQEHRKFNYFEKCTNFLELYFDSPSTVEKLFDSVGSVVGLQMKFKKNSRRLCNLQLHPSLSTITQKTIHPNVGTLFIPSAVMTL